MFDYSLFHKHGSHGVVVWPPKRENKKLMLNQIHFGLLTDLSILNRALLGEIQTELHTNKQSGSNRAATSYSNAPRLSLCECGREENQCGRSVGGCTFFI